MDKITKEMMKVISKNLMIDISDEEAQEIYLSIKSSIAEIEHVVKYDFSYIEPMEFPDITIDESFREDEVVEFENNEKLLESAQERKGRYVKV